MLNIPTIDKKRIVIIGGGFGGLKLATDLRNSNYQVVLLDKNNYHQEIKNYYRIRFITFKTFYFT
ncbi:MAG: FAD-dependent oxidoreductase [Bacteroidetes bacterium]|nr:FAD-dependent oxidoreductase [Bacteroidota bacterium]